MVERFARLRALVEQALQRPAEEREAFLRAETGADQALCDEALDVLRECETESDFLTPAPSLLAGDAGALGPGSRVGAYRIERVLGQGGMGTVFEAVQDKPRRRVALKVLRRGRNTEASRRRFQYEVEVLGTLRHPGIAQVHAAAAEGDDDVAGLTWFAMEYVPDASTLLQYTRARALDIQGRLALFLDVCDAIEHGHQHGVIHRDLKPDNLLVDGEGRVKVIDFGVARITNTEAFDATLLTQAEEILGTLPYMSPEQVAGRDVDTRSDVYALGVVLYQLLTDELPIAVSRTDLVTSARMIIEDAPTRPSALKPELKGDLEAILVKALEKEPARRYGSAAQLADDVRRHVEGLPVEARPPNALYHFRLFARRNKALVASALVVLLVALGAAVVSLNFAFKSREAELETRAQKEEAEKQRNRFATLFEAQFGQSMDAVEKHARELMHMLGGPPVAKRMIAEAIGRLQALEAMAEGDPTVTRGLIDAYMALAGALVSWGNPEADVDERTLASLGRALALVDRLAQSSPEEEHRALRAEVLSVLALRAISSGAAEVRAKAPAWLEEAGALLEAGGVPAPIEARIHEVRGLQAKIAGDLEAAIGHFGKEIDCLERAAASGNGTRPRFRLAIAYHRRATERVMQADRRRPKPQTAVEDYQKELDLLIALRAEHPDEVELGAWLVGAWIDRGMAMAQLNRTPEIEKAYGRAAAVLAEVEPQAPRHFFVMWSKARLLWAQGQLTITKSVQRHPRGSKERTDGFRRAIARWREAIAIYDRIEAHGRLNRSMEATRNNLRTAADQMERMVGGAGHAHRK